MNVELLKSLCEIPGIPGREERVRSFIEQEIDGLFDEMEVDPLGNLLATRKATRKGRGRTAAPTVLIAAHMDEIGFYVRHIDDDGFLWVNPAGGFDTRNLFSRRVLVCTKGGDFVGVMNPGGKPIHISDASERNRVPGVEEFFIDLGMPADKVKKAVKIEMVADGDTLEDKFHEECALFGIYGTSDAAAHTALGLHALQHRGQEASGIVTFDGRVFHNHRAAGLVGDIFGTQAVMEKLVGYSAIGHNRYATTGGSSDRNIQPIFADFDFGGLALAHNGNLTNAYLLRKELVRIGCLFQSTTDTEVINHLIARSNYSTVVDRLIDALGRVKGAYSLLLLTNEALIGVRDPLATCVLFGAA